MDKKKIRLAFILVLLISGAFALAQDTGVTTLTPSLSICEDGDFTITVTNEGDTIIYDVEVVATLPAKYSYRGATGSFSTGGSPVTTVTWDSFDLDPNDGALGGPDEWSYDITISPNCDADTNSRLRVDVYVGGILVETAYSGPITRKVPFLALDVTPLVQTRSVGDTATWAVTVTNTGPGDLYNVVLDASPGAGLINLSPGPGNWPMSLGDIGPGGSSGPITVTADVDSCEDISIAFTATNNDCGEGDDEICAPVVVEGGIELDYNTPNLNYTFSTDPIDIPYCGSDSVVVNVTNSGADAGNIRNFVIAVDLQGHVNVSPDRQLIITLDSSTGDISGASYDNINHEFVFPDLGPNASGTFTFSAAWNMAIPDHLCEPVSCESLIFEPYFNDDCGDEFYPPVKELPVASTPPIPSFSVTKTGPGVILDEGDVGTFTIEVTFNAPNTIITTADISDFYPATFTFDSASGGGSDNGTRVLWNDEPFTGGQTRQFTVDLEAGYGGTNCGVGIDNNVEIDDIGTVCSGCALDDVSMTYTILDSALLEVSKVGPDYLDLNGASGIYDITVTYDGPLCDFGGTNRIPPFTVVDNYPAGGVITANPDGGSIDTGARTITWTFPAQAAPAGPPYEFDLSYSLQISSSAPGYDPCLCGTVGSNNVTVTLSSLACIVCSDSTSVPFAYECDDELTAPVDIGKTSDVAAQELCECITYTNTIDFNYTGLSWDVIYFTENGDNSQLFFGGSSTGDAIFTFYDDSTSTTFGPVTGSNVINLAAALNLGFLGSGPYNFPAPEVDDILTITYTICLTSASGVGDFVDWSDVFIDDPTYQNPCITDLEFHEGAWINAYRLAPDISIGYFCHYFNDVCSFVVNKCEEAVFRIYIDQSVPSYAVTPVVDLKGNYTYIDDPLKPPVYTGILAHHTGLGTKPIYDDVASTLTWNLGDLDQPSMMGDGYIEFVLHKDCDDASEAVATITFSDNCYVEQPVVTETYNAYRTWGGEILLKKTPEVIYNTDRIIPDPEWVIYVTNRGSGYAYNVKVIDTLGAGINYVSHSVTGLSPGNPPIPPAGYMFDATGAPEYFWLIDYIPPGKTVEIHLIGDVIACAARTNQVEAFWGCGTDLEACFDDCSACKYCCEDIAPVTARVEDLSTRVVITDHSNDPIDICGDDSTIRIEYKNIGKSNAYDIILTEVLPDTLDWVQLPPPGFNMVFTPGTAPGVDCFTGFGYNSGTRTMTWNFACLQGVAPGDEYLITFDVDPGNFTPPRPWSGSTDICDFNFGDLLNLNLQYSPPCGFKGDVATNALTAEEADPQLFITKDPISVVGDPGDTLQWNIDIVNNGDSPAPFIELWDNYTINIGPIPPATELTLTPIGSTPGPISGSGTSGDPWVFDYSEVIDVGAGNAWSFTIDALVNDCADSGTNEAVVEWGCCAGETSGDTSIVITTPQITLDQSIGGSGIVDNCGGTLVVTIDNDGASGQFYELRNTLPEGFIYDSLTGTTINRTGAVLNTEPGEFFDTPNNVWILTWDTDNFTDIQKNETITITFNILHQAWGGADCSLDPGGNNIVELDWDRSALCGTPDPTTETSTALINPVVPVFTVTKIPVLQTVPPVGDPPIGDDVTWTIRLTETAGGTADGTITIVDTLGSHYNMGTVVAPDITDYTSYIATPSIVGNTITWSGLSIDPLGYIEFVLTCDTIQNPQAENLSNVVDVSGMCGVACVYADASATSNVGLDAITKDIVEDEATIGEFVQVNLMVNFYGSSTAYEDIVIADLFPTGLAYYSDATHTESHTATVPSGTPPTITFRETDMEWDVDNFIGPCVVDITFYAHVENIGTNQDGVTLTNTATADYYIGGNHYQDTATDTLDIIEADLVITKDENDGDDIVAYGDSVTYTIDVAHITGDNADAFDVVVTDIVPDGYTVVLPVPGGGSTSAGPGAGETTITWPEIDVPLGTSLTYTYTVNVDPDVEPAQVLLNTSRVEWTSTSGTPTSPAEERTGTGTPAVNDYFDEITDTVTVDTTSSITKTLDGTYTQVTIPQVMTYTITVGLPRATIPTLTVTDTMDAGIYYIAGTANVQFPNGSSSAIAPSRIIGPNDGTLTTTLGWNTSGYPIASFDNIDASSGNPLVITFNAVVANEVNVQDGLIVGNDAAYDYTDFNNNHHTDSASSRNVQVIEADLVVTKDENDGDDIVSAGDTVTYTLNVNHTASSHANAYEVVVTDIVPNGYTVILPVPGGGSTSAGPGAGETTITWPAIDTPLSTSVTYTYTVVVDNDVEPAQELENTSRVEWTSWNGTPAVGEERTGSGSGPNDYFDDTSDTVTVNNISSIHKMPDANRDVTVSGVPNLFEVDYTIEVTLPRATIPDLIVTDIIGYLDEGLYYITGAGNTTITYPGGATSNTDPSLSPTNDGTVPVTLTWDFTGNPNLVPTTGGSWNPLTIEFTAVVANIDENNDLDEIRNIASYSYVDFNDVTQGTSDESGLLVVHVPAFTIDKSVADIVSGFGIPTGTTTEVQPGDVIHYSLVINNVGTGVASNVVVTDSLPQYFEYDVGNVVLNVPYADVISPNLRDLTWNLGSIPGGGSVTINVYAVVTSGLTLLTSSYDNVADVTGEDIIGNQIPADNNDHVVDTDLDDRDNIAVTPQIPALEVDKAVLEINGAPYGGGNVTIQPDDYVTYELTVRNVGNGTAYNVGAYDNLPIGMLYSTLLTPSSYTSAAWDLTSHAIAPSITGTSATGVRLTWESPAVDVDLVGGDSYTVEYLVHVDSNIIEGLPAVNYVMGYAIDGSSTPIPTDRNADTLGADNDSTDDAWTSIATREPFLITDKVVSQIDGDPTNIEVAVIDSIVEFTITIENVGLGDAYDIDIHDTLPVGFEYVPGSTVVDTFPGADPDIIPPVVGQDLSWLGFYPAGGGVPFAPGDIITLVFEAEVTPNSSGGMHLNTMSVDAIDANGNAVVRNGAAIGITADTDEDDADDAEIYVDVPTVPFVLIKEADPRSLGPQGIVHYTVTYTNTRKIRFYDVTITDTMPRRGFKYYAGSTLIDGVPDVDPVGDNPYTWTIGTVQPETTITLEYDVVVSHAAKSGANKNTVVLRGRDSAGNPLELTTYAVVSVKRDKFKEYEEFPTETIPQEWIPGEVIEAPEGEEIIPECCLNVWKIALKSQDFGKTLPGMPEIYYQTDIAMYGATEFFMIYDYLSPRLKIEGIDPEDKHLMTGLYNRIIEKLGEYAQYNLGNVVMKSELGIPYMYSPSIISAAKKGNRRPSRILDDRLKDMAKKAGLSDVPDIEPIFLEYFGSYPYLEGKISEGDLAWGERFMDKNIMPAALGFTLLRSAFQIDEFLKSDVPEERFFGLLILSQSLEKLEAMSSDLAVTANFSNPVKYLPHFSRIEVDENRPALKYTVTDDTSTLYDHASVLWGLSKLRSVILHSQDLDVRSNLDFVTEKMNEAYESLEKIHFNEEDNTFISFRVPGDSGDYEITAKDLAFTILAMRSVLRDNRDTTIITEDPKRKIVAAADFMMENMISAKDGGVYTSYSYASSSADTGTRRTLVDNALAIRALLTAYVVTEDRKYRDAALDIYDFMLENLWVEEYLIFVDEERWDYEVVLTPQSIGALIASLRELVLYGDEDMVNDYLDKISYTTERILDQSQLQLYENRFYPWHAPLTLIPEDPNGRSYVKPIITPIRDKEVMRDLAPILVRKMVLNLTPAGAIASGDEDSVYDWNKWKANLRYEVPDLIASTLVDDTFVTDMGMYFSSLIYDYRHNINRELPSYNPYTADPDIQTYAAYLSDEVSRFNVKNLTLNSNMGIKLYDSGLIMEMAKKAGVSPEKFVRDFVGERVPEPKRPKGIFGGVLGDVKDFVSGDSRKRFDNIIYLEYAQGKPYYEKGIGEGWDEDTFDTRLNPSSVAQTMLRQILFLMDYEERDDLMPADVFEKDVMKLVVVAKHRFLVDLVKDIEKEGLDYIPHGFELKWDRDEDRYVPVVTDKSSELFDQVSLIWAMALWTKARDMGLLDEYEGYIGDKKQDNELIAKFFDALVKYHYDEARGTLVTGSVNAVEIGKALDILTRAVEILPEGENKDKMLDLISAQADFIIDEMLTDEGVLPLVDFKKKYSSDDLCEFESLGTHTFPILALFRAYEVTSNEKYLKAALGAFKIFDESKWIQELGLYMSTGTIWEGKDLTKLELTYNNVELISTILLISELQPYMEGERKILSAYHMTTFMNRLLEIASLERYPENEESGRSIYSPQIVFSVKIILSETKGNGSAGGVFTYLILVDNDCIEEWDVDHTLHRIRIEDTLPKGFHFVPGSTRINGAFAPDPIGKETLNWYYPVLRDSGRIVLRYQVVADENIPHGIIVNDLDIISFWAYNGVLYPCDGFVEEGVRIYDEVEILDELGDGKCVPCDPEELKRIQYQYR